MIKIPTDTTLIRLTPIEYQTIQKYLVECNYSGFQGINNYSRANEVREIFFKWHLNELTKKFNKARNKKMSFVSLNFPELKTMQEMFKRIDCTQDMIRLQIRFYKF